MSKKKINDETNVANDLQEESILNSLDKDLIEDYNFETLDLVKLSKDVKKNLISVSSKEEARFIEDYYYQTQKRRIALQGQLRSIAQNKDSNLDEENTAMRGNTNTANIKEAGNGTKSFMEWMLLNAELEEQGIKKALEIFSDNNYLSKWAKSNIGIGPVIATCLCANLEIKDNGNNDTNMHAGSWWSYCGLNDNNRPWLSGAKCRELIKESIDENNGILDDYAVMRFASKTKWSYEHFLNAKGCHKEDGSWSEVELAKAASIIPYNKNLKVLMYKIGHSFRMQKNNPNSLYGRLLVQREAYEMDKNVKGEYKEQALECAKKVGKNTVAYKSYSKGELPPAHIAQRAERYVTKLFISHLFEAAYYNKYGRNAPKPYVLCFGDHVDYIGPEVPYDSIERDC